MSVDTFTVKGLHAWHHRVDTTDKPRIVIIHGLCEHSGRHLSTINQLTAAGYECVRFDLRGHGESAGKRQWIEHFDDYIDDVSAIFDWIEQQLPPKPVFLHGHSLGATIALQFSARYQQKLSGLFVNAPAYKVGDGVSAVKILLAKTINRVLPKLTMKSNLDISAISRDPDVIRDSMDDPLVCDFNTSRQGYEILSVLPMMPETVKKITIPILFTHGEQDRLSLASGTEELFKHCAARDKEYHCFKDAYHEVHNDLDSAAYFQKLLSWLEAH